MTRTTRLTYALLAGSFILICISVYVLLSQAQDLAKARKELDRTNRELAERQAQLLVVSDALIANQDQVDMVGRSTREVAKNCARPELLTAPMRALCAVNEWVSSSSGQFVPAYAQATVVRASAASPSDWNEVKSRYQALKSLLEPGVSGHDLWAARIEEGIAYSDYRLGNLNEASSGIERALLLDDRSAFVGLTRLKVGCARKLPKEEIAKLYSDHRRNLEESVKNPKPPMDKRYAGFERGYFDRDPEYRIVCAYAELPAAG